jgi:alkylhydroperoxidase family enzyme
MNKQDIDVLRTAGFSDEAILDATCVAAYFNYINRMSDALGVELEQVYKQRK